MKRSCSYCDGPIRDGLYCTDCARLIAEIVRLHKGRRPGHYYRGMRLPEGDRPAIAPVTLPIVKFGAPK